MISHNQKLISIAMSATFYNYYVCNSTQLVIKQTFFISSLMCSVASCSISVSIFTSLMVTAMFSSCWLCSPSVLQTSVAWLRANSFCRIIYELNCVNKKDNKYKLLPLLHYRHFYDLFYVNNSHSAARLSTILAYQSGGNIIIFR